MSSLRTECRFHEPPIGFYMPDTGERAYVDFDDERPLQYMYRDALSRERARIYAPGEKAAVWAALKTGEVVELREHAVYRVTTPSGNRVVFHPRMARATVDLLDSINYETMFVKAHWMTGIQHCEFASQSFPDTMALGNPKDYMGALADSFMFKNGNPVPREWLCDALVLHDTKNTLYIKAGYKLYGTKQYPYFFPGWVHIEKLLDPPNLQSMALPDSKGDAGVPASVEPIPLWSE